jgi:hypothetical protein
LFAIPVAAFREVARVVVIHGTNFNVTGSVLNCDKLTFFYLSSVVWTVNFSIINIASGYLKVLLKNFDLSLTI